MLEYLIQLPCEVLGQNMLGFLELIDIIQFENAAASHKSHQLLREILPYCPPLVLSDSFNQVNWKQDAVNWFNGRRCRINFIKIELESLSEVKFERCILDNIELCLSNYLSLRDIGSLCNHSIDKKVICLKIKGSQEPGVMTVLFSLLSSGCSVRSLDIMDSPNLSEWLQYIKEIGPYLFKLNIHGGNTYMSMIKSITEHCPYLDQLSLDSLRGVSDSNFLQNIANNCPHLRSLYIKFFNYNNITEADADLTAFAEKCPQLEELSLTCHQLTDQSVTALAQHCSGLKKLKLNGCKLTTKSLIALSERGLPLEELDIPKIPVLSAEIAAQCAKALSRIRILRSILHLNNMEELLYAIQYMTGLRELVLSISEDDLLVFLLLLRHCCAGLVSITIGIFSGITPEQLSELLRECRQLRTLHIRHHSCISTAVLVELAGNFPHLQEITLHSSGVTEEGVLTLAAHCRQLREIDLGRTKVTEDTVRQLAQHCRHLTKLNLWVNVREGEVMVVRNKSYSSMGIRALRL